MEVVSTTTTTEPVNMYNHLNQFVMNPMVFVIIALIIVTYYVFSSLGNNNSSTFSISSSTSSSEPKFSSNVMTTIIGVILVILILLNAFQYFFSINLTAYIKGLFTNETKMDLVVEESSKIIEQPLFSIKKEVFNIPGNYYNFQNAKALCKAFDSELATYDQIEKAYENGAEWCNYGWSDKQMALFPTQPKTFNHLQTIEGHENDCGRAGINGGFIANPKVRFGVNCYGYKPKISEEEEELMRTSSPYPKSIQDQIFQKRVDFWKEKTDEILVSPFNNTIWSSP